jgi:polar amino acid transport system substrate-binding protein
MTASDGSVIGLTANPANTAFEKAKVSYMWQRTPSKRQMLILQSNDGRDCLVGWFKNPEREKFAKFTNAIYQDKPTIALALANNNQIKSGVTVESVLGNKELLLLVKDGYSYGDFVDDLITKINQNYKAVTTENIEMFKMLQLGRVDYFFIAEEEAEYLIHENGVSRDEVYFVRFNNMPPGNKRYILCSQNVEDEVISKLNAAITFE